jgi:hypothetical protein
MIQAILCKLTFKRRLIINTFPEIGMFTFKRNVYLQVVALGGLIVIVLTIIPKVRGLKPDREQWVFKGDTNQQNDFLRRGSKAVGMLKIPCGMIDTDRQNAAVTSRPVSPRFSTRCLC